jgi:uncharacterized OB-fold protein
MDAEEKRLLRELLRTSVCLDCGTARLAEVRFCPSCRSGSSRTVLPDPRGRLVSFTEVHRAPVDDLEWELPFTIGLLELDAGSRCLGLLEWKPRIEDIERRVDLSLRMLESGLPLVLAKPAANP